MAAPAAAPTLVEPQAVPLAVGKRSHFTGAEAVYATVSGKQHALEACQALGKIGGGHSLSEGGFEKSGVFLMRAQPLHSGLHGPTHFRGAFDGPERLVLQRCLSSIPEESTSIGAIPE